MHDSFVCAGGRRDARDHRGADGSASCGRCGMSGRVHGFDADVRCGTSRVRDDACVFAVAFPALGGAPRRTACRCGTASVPRAPDRLARRSMGLHPRPRRVRMAGERWIPGVGAPRWRCVGCASSSLRARARRSSGRGGRRSRVCGACGTRALAWPRRPGIYAGAVPDRRWAERAGVWCAAGPWPDSLRECDAKTLLRVDGLGGFGDSRPGAAVFNGKRGTVNGKR